MKPILVTGATGLVGNNVVRRLLDRGEAVRAMVRESSDRRPLSGLDVDVRYGDIRDADAVGQAINGCHAVVHAAAYVHIGWTGSELARTINVDGTRNVANAARDAGARLIHVSSVDALGGGTTEKPVDESPPHAVLVDYPYAVTKRQAELTVLRMVGDGLNAVVVNPSFMLGPWDWKPSSGRLLLSIARFRWSFAPRGTNDFTSASDVVDAIITAIERGDAGERYILSGENRTYLSAFRTIADACGVSRAFFSIGAVGLYPSAWIGDLATKLTDREGDVNSAAIRMMRLPRVFSHDKATRELDYRPRGLQIAAEEAWVWLREHGYAKTFFGKPLPGAK